LFSGIAIKFALLHLVKKWPNLKMAMQTKAYCTTTRLMYLEIRVLLSPLLFPEKAPTSGID